MRKIGFAVLGMSLIMASSYAIAGDIGVNSYIDDSTETITATTNGNNSSINITQEGIGVIGTVDIHFDYVSTNPLANGDSQTFNFNMYEDNGAVSDTWSITLTGQAGGVVHVDEYFKSDSLDDISPTALTSATTVPELYSFSPLGDNLTVGASSVPEPSTFALLGLGGVGLAIRAYRRRQAKVVA